MCLTSYCKHYQYSLSRTPSGLLFYVGDSSGGEESDFLAVYLQNGSVVLQLNLGSGREGYTGEGRSVGSYDDGVRHSIEVCRSGNQADLVVDGVTVEVTAPGEDNEDLQYMCTYIRTCAGVTG